MKHTKLIISACVLLPGGLVALGVLSVFSPSFRKNVVDHAKKDFGHLFKGKK
jgi:hypothetical protein